MGAESRSTEVARRRLLNRLNELEISQYVQASDVTSARSATVGFHLLKKFADEWAPGGDTMHLCARLDLQTQTNSIDLEREILLAMLLCPIPFEFPSYDELTSAVRIRKSTVEAARKTALAFATQEAERPTEYWNYDEDRGFILVPDQPLVTALQKATQPDESGQRYTFSCRRAGEYVVLLSLAQEAMTSNPELFQQLHQQAETRAIKGGEFERVFQRTIGSLGNPLPLKFFVPGDRTWFRNPEEVSSGVTGYEGSWTFYLGDGLFADFWREDKKYTLTTKCLAMFHWRHALYRDDEGDLQINEQVVEERVEQTLRSPTEVDQILQEMLRLQAPLGTYAGGAIEAHREYPRQVCPGTSDVVLPDVERK
jgi:protein-glutamine gamma-glutamyltransferase-like protein